MKVLLDEQPDQAWADRSDLSDPVVPHRLIRQPSLAKRHVVDLQTTKPLSDGHFHRDVARLRNSALSPDEKQHHNKERGFHISLSFGDGFRQRDDLPPFGPVEDVAFHELPDDYGLVCQQPGAAVEILSHQGRRSTVIDD